MDCLWNCAYGIDMDFQNNPSNNYFRRCEIIFRQMDSFNVFMYLGSINGFFFAINDYYRLGGI
jgi:hypothetical protein